jgi:hypothetical protein
MIPMLPPDDDNSPSRSDGALLTLKALVLVIIAAGVVVLWVHDSPLGAAVLAAVTVLALLARLVS